MTKLKQGIAIIVLLVSIIIIAGCASTNNTLANSTPTNNTHANNGPADMPKQNATPETKGNTFNENKNGFGGCTGTGTINFSVSPMRLEDIGVIIPMGLVIDGHVTPIDHIYFQPTIFQSPADSYDVYADGNGVINSIGREAVGNGNDRYRIIIYHTCKFYSIYNLLTSLSPRILGITGTIPPGGYSSAKIPVTEGELLGKIGGQTLDLSINYDDFTLKGFIVPSHYEAESWKIHTVDPFDYFNDPVRSELLAKDVRQAEPRGGKIDYDIDGRLVGNWFVENTNGYSGIRTSQSGYWVTHAAFVYDHIDPTHIVISLGNFSGQAKQFGVKNNLPDPKDVSVSSGLAKYELVDSDYVLGNGHSWDRRTYANDIKAVSTDHISGVLLVQLVSDRRLKLEVFPGKTLSEVTAFDGNAIFYER